VRKRWWAIVILVLVSPVIVFLMAYLLIATGLMTP
jgi:hypothetical protein